MKATSNKILWLDVETTGLNPKVNSIIDLGAIIEIDNKIEGLIRLQPKPFKDDPIENKALEVNKITRKELSERTFSQEDFVITLRDKLSLSVNKFNKNDKFVIAGYNVGFDTDFLRQAFYRTKDKYYGSWFFWPSIDVQCEVAKAILGGLLCKNYQLETICKYYNIPIEAHSALEDIKATRDLYIKLAGGKQYENSDHLTDPM